MIPFGIKLAEDVQNKKGFALVVRMFHSFDRLNPLIIIKINLKLNTLEFILLTN